MKTNLKFLWLGIMIPWFLGGCGNRETGSQTQIDHGARMMKEAIEPSKPAHVTPSDSAPSVAAQSPAPPQQFNDALAAYKGGDYVDSVERFHALRSSTAISAQQLIALNEALAGVMNDLYSRAANGDAKAQAAIQEYQRLQSGHRK